jgi:hypothetical protein
MTTYTTHYDGLESDAKAAKALEDIVQYMGWLKFTELSRVAREDRDWTLAQWRMTVSFVGVQGYPAQAWYEHLFGPEKTDG